MGICGKTPVLGPYFCDFARLFVILGQVQNAVELFGTGSFNHLFTIFENEAEFGIIR